MKSLINIHKCIVITDGVNVVIITAMDDTIYPLSTYIHIFHHKSIFITDDIIPAMDDTVDTYQHTGPWRVVPVGGIGQLIYFLVSRLTFMLN